MAAPPLRSQVGHQGSLTDQAGGLLAPGTYTNRNFTSNPFLGTGTYTFNNCRMPSPRGSDGGPIFPAARVVTLNNCTVTGGIYFEDNNGVGGHKDWTFNYCYCYGGSGQAIRPKGTGTITVNDSWLHADLAAAPGAHTEVMQVMFRATLIANRVAFSQRETGNNTVTAVMTFENPADGEGSVLTDCWIGYWNGSSWSAGGGAYKVYPAKSHWYRPVFFLGGSSASAWYTTPLVNVSPSYNGPTAPSGDAAGLGLITDTRDTVSATGSSVTYGHDARDNVVGIGSVVNPPVTDDFNRANGGLGPDWTTVTGTANPQIVSSTARATSSYTGTVALWTAEAFTADQVAQASLTLGANSSSPAVIVRGQTGSVNYYIASWDYESGGRYTIAKMVNGLWTTLASKTGVGTSGTRVFRLEAAGTSLQLFVGEVSELATADSEFASGAPGISLYYTNGSTPIVDDFVAGSLAGVAVAGSGGVTDARDSITGMGAVTNPASQATDDFNRANGGLGANWTTVTGESAPIIASNTARYDLNVTGVRRSAWWNADAFMANQFSQAVIAAGTNYSAPGVIVRTQPSAASYYIGAWDPNGSGTYYLAKVVAGAWTSLATKPNVGYSGTRTFKVEVEGTALRLFVNGVQELTATDSALTTGSPGISLYVTSGATPILDDWVGGSLFTPPPAAGAGAPTDQRDAAAGAGVVLNPSAGAGYVLEQTDVASGEGSFVPGEVSAYGDATDQADVVSAAGSAVAPPWADVTDDFNRANGGLGSNWTTSTGAGAPVIASGKAQANTNSSGVRYTAWWNARAFTGDHFSEMLLTAGTTYSVGAVVVRSQPSSLSMYVGSWDSDNGGTYRIFKLVGGTFVGLVSTTNVGYSGSRTFRLEAQGSALRLLVNGVEELTTMDSSFNGGAPGVYFYFTSGATPTGDDWVGGNMEAGAVVTGSGAVTDGGDVPVAAGSAVPPAGSAGAGAVVDGLDGVAGLGSVQVFITGSGAMVDVRDTVAGVGSGDGAAGVGGSACAGMAGTSCWHGCGPQYAWRGPMPRVDVGDQPVVYVDVRDYKGDVRTPTAGRLLIAGPGSSVSTVVEWAGLVKDPDGLVGRVEYAFSGPVQTAGLWRLWWEFTGGVVVAEPFEFAVNERTVQPPT